MNKKEINEFIEEMESIGDIWTEEQVKDVYGNKTLEEALLERKSEVDLFLSSIAKAFLHFNREDGE